MRLHSFIFQFIFLILVATPLAATAADLRSSKCTRIYNQNFFLRPQNSSPVLGDLTNARRVLDQLQNSRSIDPGNFLEQLNGQSQISRAGMCWQLPLHTSNLAQSPLQKMANALLIGTPHLALFSAVPARVAVHLPADPRFFYSAKCEEEIRLALNQMHLKVSAQENPWGLDFDQATQEYTSESAQDLFEIRRRLSVTADGKHLLSLQKLTGTEVPEVDHFLLCAFPLNPTR